MPLTVNHDGREPVLTRGGLGGVDVIENRARLVESRRARAGRDDYLIPANGHTAIGGVGRSDAGIKRRETVRRPEPAVADVRGVEPVVDSVNPAVGAAGGAEMVNRDC